MTKLYLAIPCYNEEEVLRDSAEKLLNKYSTMMAEGKISADSRIVFIDDGSKDRTWEIISELHTENPIFQGIKLSRNRGHQTHSSRDLQQKDSTKFLIIWALRLFLTTLISDL